LTLTGPAAQPNGEFPGALVGCGTDSGKALAQFTKQTMRPNVFGRQNDQADRYKDHALQKGQEEANDAQQNESPPGHEYQDALDSRLHFETKNRLTATI
jgi:hypothetical protein